ncbi:hypothetical protein [Mesorhizobium sp. YM1C-6-2]|uniref:hypothetical protein n=1 Tax=Mesorhizobium sp. YM1C-6-2 TaxID=1827501 RepID=UPI00160427A8|nr:hypothetical protein [Mesorhizobium sp. YM1C-6-2]
MTMLKVLKPFNTRIQRFSAGDDVPDGADVGPHTIENLAAGKFIAEPDKPSGKKSKPAE